MRRLYHIPVLFLLYVLSSCSTTNNFTTRYYEENKDMLNSVRRRFQEYYNEKPFHIEFKDKSFRYMSYEILTDTTRFIYNFDLEEASLADSLDKYGYNTPRIIELIADMRRIRCTWISKLDYYENREKKTLVFISVRHNQLESLLNGEKYYALAFFNERQSFDTRGRLTDKSEKKPCGRLTGRCLDG